MCSCNGEHIEYCQPVVIGHRIGDFLEVLVERRNGLFRQNFSVRQARRADDGLALCLFPRQGKFSKIDKYAGFQSLGPENPSR